MNTNTELLHVIERQLLEVVGVLAMADSPEDVTYAKGRLVGVIHGLRIVADNAPEQEQEHVRNS